MNRLAVIAKRYSYAATAALLTAAMLAPTLILGSAGAAQITERSLKLDSSIAGATGVTYELQFNLASDNDIQAVVVDFCSNSPISGTGCTPPGGIAYGSSVTAGTTGTAFTGTWSVAQAAAETTAITIESTATESNVAEGDTLTFTLAGFTNPAAEGTVYARVYTFGTTGAADAYTSEVPGTYVDNGAVAFALVQRIDVTAVVRETLTFCVAGGTTANPAVSSIDDDCGGTRTAPTVSLGSELETGIFVIDASAVYTGNVFYQLTTNAANGTSVNIKGASTVLESGSNTIASTPTPAVISAGTAAFGINVPNPALTPPEEGDELTLGANFSSAANTYSVPAATTSTYGTPLTSATGPVLNANGSLVFGATASPNTPAGIYKASYNLIATPSY